MSETNTNESRALAPPQESVGRRRFLETLSVVLGGICAVGIAVPGVAFVVAPIFSKIPELWRDVGKADGFHIGETVQVSFLDSSPLPWAGVTARTAAWLRRLTETEFVAFAVNCSHLGCPVRWMAQAGLFMCPCHGGVYYSDGSVAAGPPPRPLMRYPVRVENGQVQIRTRPLPIT